MKPDSLDDLSLDELFQQAKRSLAGQKKQRAATKTPAAPAEETAAQRLYSNPDNWIRTRGIALIEEETETLLGNFSEYLHKSVPGTRRLVREVEPISVEAVEYIKGWIPGDERIEAPLNTKPILVTAYLQLELFGLAGVRAAVLVYLQYGSIVRVELSESVNFSTPGEELFCLPAGTNVFEVLTPTSLKALYLELPQ